MNTKLLHFLLVVLFLLGNCLCGNCFAGNSGYVKRTILRLSRALEIEQPKKRTAKLVRELHRSFDYRQFEKRVLKDAATKFTPSQHRRFSKAFQQMFERKILALADDSSLQCDTYEVKEGNTKLEITVTCVQQKRSDAVVLHFSPTSKKKITDLTFSGALLSRNYRGIINKFLRRDGAEALINKIKDKSSESLTKKSLL